MSFNLVFIFLFLEVHIATKGPFVSVAGTFRRCCQTSVQRRKCPSGKTEAAANDRASSASCQRTTLKDHECYLLSG